MTALYDTIGPGYRSWRQPDPRIAAAILDALGDARSLVNIGAGAGSYEPRDRPVVAIEPSATMIAQRAPDAAPVIQASAEAVPLADKSFDAASAFLTTHHWSDMDAGLREMKRLARRRCVFFDHDPAGLDFWLINDYFPELRESLVPLLPLDRARAVFENLRDVPIPVPHDCTDGFLAAYWRRPEIYLDAGARGAISFFAKLDDVGPRIARLRADLEDGTWARRHGHILRETAMDFGYRLVIAEIGD